MAEFLVPQRLSLSRREGTLEEHLPPSHLVRFVWKTLESLDFSALEKLYDSIEGGPGRPPYHPRLLAALWIYGMTEGLKTATDIAGACTNRDDFRWLAGGLTPCDQTFLNFVTIAREGLPGIWEQVLRAMHEAGHVDLSALAEDGTKLRANVSPRSFHPIEEIEGVIQDLKARLVGKLAELVPPEARKRHETEVRGLQDRLERAEQAVRNLKDEQSPTSPEAAGGERPRRPCRKQDKFMREQFRHDPGRDVMICPQGKELAFVGVYPTESGRGDYRLYRRKDCSDCAVRSQCTEAKGRVLKIPVKAGPTPAGGDGGSSESAPGANPQRDEKSPVASVTDPEARLMLGGGSVKRIEPSYNADITVTRHGVIVSQFLTNDPTDYGHFRRALPAVVSVFGRPDAWIGDGHYATHANLVLADQAGVPLYAPMQSLERDESGKFTTVDFRHDSEKDVLVCPAGRDLVKVGRYGEDTDRPYDLYGRTGCGDCPLKPRCTTGSGRRVKRHAAHHLLAALENRMKQFGESTQRFRGQTVEPVNAQLKQHGLGRLHLRGLTRCGVVLTLACIAHNLIKWKAREAARVLKRAS